MTPRPDQPGKPRDAFDQAIQSILDAPIDDPRRRDLIDALARDPAAMRDLRASADALSRLRDPVDAPDLSARILHAAHQRRRFLPPRLRVWVARARATTALALLLLLAITAIAQRQWPQATRLADADRPLSALPRALGEDAVLSAGLLADSLSRARGALAPIAPPDANAQPSLRLEAWVLSVVGPDGSVYDTVMTYDRSAPRQSSLRVFTLPPRPDAGGFSLDPAPPAPVSGQAGPTLP